MRLCLPLLAALSLVPAGVSAQTGAIPPMTLEQQMLLRCSSAFALVAQRQAQGEAAALAYPPLGERGREYFVRAMARLMDERGLTREQVAALARRETERMQGEDLAQVMDPCLFALEASGL